jgi:transcription elongation factor Elf1
MEVKMPNQEQCPNCGGYKVTSQKVAVKKVTPIPMQNRLKVAGALFGAAVVGILLALAIGTEWSIGCGGFLAFSWLVGAFVNLFKTSTTKVIGYSYDFYCLICGYRWKWREDQPWPKVNVNPNLIAKGAQKLEEEEETERRRQQEAALYYLSQQGKK